MPPWVSRTLYSADDVGASDVIYLRDFVQDTAGAMTTSNQVAKVPLFDDKLKLEVYDANSNGINVDVFVILE